jgi:hypothetical protein
MSTATASLLAQIPRTDGLPQRAVTCVNVRREEKAVFDHLVSWWRLECGEELTQWDAFSVLLAAALENPRLEAPRELRERHARVVSSGSR